MEVLFSVDGLLALATLSAMEIVLGIDNIVFIAILAGRLAPENREKARNLGLILGLVLRVALLFSISFLMSLTRPFITVFDHSFSGKDLILIAGGLFLIFKSTREIHHKIEDNEPSGPDQLPRHATMGAILLQIAAIDVVFSLDSVITAVGMADSIHVMVVAMFIAMGTMLIFAGKIGDFVERHPTVKILALSFLLMIGGMLTAEGMGFHFPKGYLYFAMAFSLGVELLNFKVRKKG